MKWLDAIIEVLREAEEPMHYGDIAVEIVETKKRDKVGVSPELSVAAIISKHPDIFVRDERGTYKLNDSFDYEQWKKSDHDTESDEQTSINQEIKKRSKNIVRTYGVYWRREDVDWSKSKPQLLGSQSDGDVVDFGAMRGIYMLCDHREPIYVGQAIKNGLGERLRNHTKDRHANRWNRFSWFGIDGVNQTGSIHKVNTFSVEIADVANALEAVMIEGLEPRQNRKSGNYFDGAEYAQVSDKRLEEKRVEAYINNIMKR